LTFQPSKSINTYCLRHSFIHFQIGFYYSALSAKLSQPIEISFLALFAPTRKMYKQSI